MNQNVQGYDGIIEDISERERIEEELSSYREHLEEVVKARTAELCQEVEARKQMEEALKDSEKRFKGIFENIVDVYYRADLTGNLTQVSPSGVRLLEYNNLEEIIGKNLASDLYYRPEDREIFLRELKDKGVIINYEVTLKRKDGTPLVGEVSSQFVYDEIGKPMAVEGIFRDITERKQAEAELQKYRRHLEELVEERTAKLQQEVEERKRIEESLQQLKKAIETIHVGVTITDLDRKILYANPAEAEMHGYQPENLIGKHVGIFAPPDRHKPMTSEQIQKMQTWSHESVNIRKDGSVFPVQLISDVVRTPAGEPTAIVTICEDITTRKWAEENLRESEEKYRQLFEGETDAIMVFDAETFRFEDANRATLELFGYPKEEFLTLTVEDISAEEKKPLEISQKVKEQGDQGLQVSLCYKKKKDGNIFPVEMSSGSFISKGRKKIIEAIRDITGRVQAEEEHRYLEAQIRQSQKLEALGTLAGGVAHDFNNILGTMLGYTEVLLREFPEKSKEKTYLERVYRAGERASELVQQILFFSRSQEHQLIPTDIAPILEETLNMMRATIPTTVELRQDIQPNCRPILADATQIRQIIVNLCVNASHAMKERGGTLEVSLEEVTSLPPNLPAGLPTDSSQERGIPHLKLMIRDTGCGMRPDVQEHIFEPFFTTKGIGEGVGLGLSVVYGIVKGHHGVITVESDPGKGTIFHIFFPVTEELVSQEERARDDTTVIMGKEHILIIEDEGDLAELYEIALTKLGYHVTTLHHGDEALELFRSNPVQFDLVFTDQTMPRMTGAQLSQEFLNIRADIPIILATGYSNTILEEKVKALGICHFLMKPVKVSDLIQIIQKIFAMKTRRHKEE